jgi:hypothetical protein
MGHLSLTTHTDVTNGPGEVLALQQFHTVTKKSPAG